MVIEINSVLPSYLSEANGSIDITVSGATLPYIYSWSNGSANEDLINVVGGLYTISVTDDLGCVLDENITVDDKTTLVDIDGNSYNLKKFGSNIWITENLKTTRDRFGGQITFHNPNNDPVNTDDFGPLYWTNSVNNSFCPLNWRVATDLDWQDLEIFLGMSPVQAGASGLRGMTEGDDLKEGGAAGFNAKYAGYRTSSGSFLDFGTSAYFFTSPDGYRYIQNSNSQIGRKENDDNEHNYLSVRCVLDK